MLRTPRLTQGCSAERNEGICSVAVKSQHTADYFAQFALLFVSFCSTHAMAHAFVTAGVLEGCGLLSSYLTLSPTVEL